MEDAHNPRRPIKGSMAGQLVVNRYLRSAVPGWRAWWRPLYRAAVNQLGKSGRVVRTWVGKHDLVVPINDPQIIMSAEHSASRDHYFRLGELILAAESESTVIDIGAGAGYWLSLMRSHVFIPVLAIESTPGLHRLLNRNTFGMDDIETFCGAVGESGPALNIESGVSGLRRITMEFPKFQSPRWIHIGYDVNGLLVIDSQKDWLAEIQPVISVDLLPSRFYGGVFDGVAASAAFARMGYTRFVVVDASGALVLTGNTADAELLEEITNYFGARSSFPITVHLFAQKNEHFATRMRELGLRHGFVKAALSLPESIDS
ncbi:hypothetical protein EBR96_00335 [bacterium]|nr:hypothetical protein [bacterium]